MDTCNKCGARLPENTKFCSRCGAPQDRANPRGAGFDRRDNDRRDNDRHDHDRHDHDRRDNDRHDNDRYDHDRHDHDRRPGFGIPGFGAGRGPASRDITVTRESTVIGAAIPAEILVDGRLVARVGNGGRESFDVPANARNIQVLMRRNGLLWRSDEYSNIVMIPQSDPRCTFYVSVEGSILNPRLELRYKG